MSRSLLLALFCCRFPYVLHMLINYSGYKQQAEHSVPESAEAKTKQQTTYDMW